MKRLPTVPCSVLPPEMLEGTSRVRFGSVEMTLYSFMYRASCESLSRSITVVQIGKRLFCVPDGSISRISDGCDCAYASERLIAIRKPRASAGLLLIQFSCATYVPTGQNLPSTG